MRLMRTTIDLDDDVLAAAKDLARRQNQSLGVTVSVLVRRGLAPERKPQVEIRNGVPVWVHGPGAIPVTSELVRSLVDEE